MSLDEFKREVMGGVIGGCWLKIAFPRPWWKRWTLPTQNYTLEFT